MPTENRSSNTEMAADQLPPCADDVFKNGVSACLVGDVPKHAAETICQSLSAITGWKIDWHYIGGRTHIKALAPVAQPNPEPIAWMVGTAIWWTKEEAERDAAATGLSIVGLGPMTGAAPAAQHQGEPVALKCWSCKADFTLKERADCDGCCWKCGAEIELDDYVEKYASEVERLRHDVIAWQGLAGDRLELMGDLRAKLAERDALLREWLDDLEKLALNRPAWEKVAAIKAALSASAEPKSCGACAGCTNGCQLDKDSPPSAQAERDELVPAALMLRQAGFGNLADAVDEARAALDRKS